MRKLSQINEGLWKSSIRRSSTDEIRKEDEYKGKTNIDEMEEVVMNSQIWSSDLLTIHMEGENGPRLSHTYESIQEIPKKVLKGWRLPTVDDFYKLYLDGTVDYDSCNDVIIYEYVKVYEKEAKRGHHLTFESDFVYMVQEDSDGNNVVSVEFDEIIPAWANPKKNWCRLTQTSGDKQILVMLIKDKKNGMD